MYNLRYMISLLVTIVLVIIIGDAAYADTNQIIITKDKVFTFNGSGFVYTRDGKSKNRLEGIDEYADCNAILHFGKYIILSNWEGHQTDSVGLLDTDSLICDWFYSGNVCDYTIQKDKLYLKLIPVLGTENDIEYASVDNKGIRMLNKIDKTIKFTTGGNYNINTICNVDAAYLTGSIQSSLINDRKFNRQYNNIDNIQCFQADNNNIYLIQKVSGYNAPPLSNFIVIDRKSGIIKIQPIFVKDTNSLQFYGKKLIFWGRNYYTAKNKNDDEAYAAVFLIDKNGKNISPLYKNDGAPFDAFNIMRAEINKVLKPGSKVKVPNYKLNNRLTGEIKFDKNEKLYSAGCALESANKAVGFFTMINSKTRLIIFDKGSKTGKIIQDGLPCCDIFSDHPQIIMNRFILFTDNKCHKCLYDINTNQIKQVSSNSSVKSEMQGDSGANKYYVILKERCFDTKANMHYRGFLYNLLNNNKVLLNDSLDINQLRTEFISGQYFVYSYQTALHILDLNKNKKIIDFDGQVDWKLKDNNIYFACSHGNVLEVGYFDMKNKLITNIYKGTFNVKPDHNIQDSGQSIEINDKVIKITFYDKYWNNPIDLSIDLSSGKLISN